VAAASVVQRGFVLGELAYGDQTVLNLETPQALAAPVPEPVLLDAGLWKLNGKAFWKTPGQLAVSSNYNNSSGSAFTTNAYPVAGSWTAGFNYDIGLMSTPPADYVTFTVQGLTPASTSHTPNPGFALMWRYYEGSIRTTQLKMYTNGVMVLATNNLAPVNLVTGGPARMSVSHDAAARTVTVITEQAAGAVTNVFSGVNMQAAVGAASAFIGFGAFTGGYYAENIVSDLTFTTTPLDDQTLPAYVAFDTVAGSGTLIKRGTAALGLMGDQDRPTSNVVLRLEQGGLVLGKASEEPLSSVNGASDWIFSDKRLGGCDDTLKICEYQSYFTGTAMSARRMRIGVPWTATFKLAIGKSTTQPADGFSFFCTTLRNGSGSPRHDRRERVQRDSQELRPALVLLSEPWGQRAVQSECRPQRLWDSGTGQSYLPVMITNGFVTAFSLRYEPAAGTLTSVMSRDGLVVTNTFTGINLAADVQDTAAYIGFAAAPAVPIRSCS
jgi:hypothetical protein